MYVTSIQSKINKLNFRISHNEFEDFKVFVTKYNKTSDNYYYCDSIHSSHSLVLTSDHDSALTLMEQFKVANGTHIDGVNYYASGRQDDYTKYVANFHTKNAAQEFHDYLCDYVNPVFKGVNSVLRNSVIYYCNCQTTGYEIAKEFENEFLNKVLEKVVSDEEPQPVHPIDDEQKIYDFKEEVVVTENSTMNKIFSIFKGSLTNSDNNKDK